MKTLPILLLIFTALVIPTIGQDAKPMPEPIEDLNAHINSHDEYKSADTMGKLAFLAEWNRDRRLNRQYTELSQIVKSLTDELIEATPDEPEKRLALIQELLAEAAYKKKLNGLSFNNFSNMQRYHVTRLLYRDDSYLKKDTMARIAHLQELGEKYNLRYILRPFLNHETSKIIFSEKGPEAQIRAIAKLRNDGIEVDNVIGDQAGFRALRNFTSQEDYKKKSIEEKSAFLANLVSEKLLYNHHLQSEIRNLTEEALKGSGSPRKALEILSDLKKKKVVNWSNFYSDTEDKYLIQLLQTDEAYKNADPKGKIAYLQKLDDEGLITSFAQSDQEVFPAAELVKADPDFKEGNLSSVKKITEKLRKNREIHTFTPRKLEKHFQQLWEKK